MPSLKHRLRYRLKAYLGTAVVALMVTLVLAFVFMAYLQPEFMLDVGTRIQLCF